MAKQTIVIDIDGPLVNYNAAYGSHWERVFGEKAHLVNPKAYWAFNQWDVRKLKGEELDMFTRSFDEQFWSSIPPTEHAVKDVRSLSQSYDVIACTTSDPRYNSVRKEHLKRLGFEIAEVVSVGKSADPKLNPKADTINAIKPVAVIDDLPLGLKDLDPSIRRFLFARAMKDPRHPKNAMGAFSGRYRVVSRIATVMLTLTLPPTY